MVIALMNSISLALPDFDDFLDIPVFVFDFVLGKWAETCHRSIGG
jgi:hypothetical protein